MKKFRHQHVWQYDLSPTNSPIWQKTERSKPYFQERFSIFEPPVESKKACGFTSFIGLKILFFDILITVGDVGSDFAQGYSLIKSNIGNNWIYGIVTLLINWLPGLVS